MLHHIMEESIPSLKDVLAYPKLILSPQKLPFEELFRYVELVKECRTADQLFIVQNEHQKYLAILDN